MRHVLESFIRRRFFVVHLVLLSVAALLCARIVTSVAGHMVTERLKISAPAAPKVATFRPSSGRAGDSRDFAAASTANIFEGKREQVQEVAVPTEAAPPPPAEEGCTDASPTGLRLRLVGTLVFSDPEFSTASIVDESKSGTPAAIYSINACVERTLDPEDPNSKLAGKPPPCNRVGDSAVVRRIEPERVCIWNESESRFELVGVEAPKSAGGAVAKRSGKDAAPAGEESGRDIRKTGENSFEVGQGEVDKALNNLAELSTQARIVPAFEAGKTVGFKLFSIRPGSLYSKIGLQNGDVVTRINGYEMNSPEKGLEVYGKLKDTKQVTVDVKRRGKPMTLDYNIVP